MRPKWQGGIGIPFSILLFVITNLEKVFDLESLVATAVSRLTLTTFSLSKHAPPSWLKSVALFISVIFLSHVSILVNASN